MARVLPSGCGVCGQQNDLLQCAGCKVLLYCGRDHQVAHRPSHKSACSALRRARKEEEALRNHPGDFALPEDPFTNGVGHFWGLYDTRDYMRARFALVDAMTKINSTESVEAQLGHLMDMLRLCRSDNMGVRDLVPALMLRLNKDQECYDFIKWWFIVGDDSHFDWGDMSLPYLDIKDADVFEPVDRFRGQFRDLSHLSSLTLLKIKLLLDLSRLEQSSSSLGISVPREILDMIHSSVPHSPADLKAQIDALYGEVHKANKFFWLALINPSKHTGRPMAYSRGSMEETQLNVCYNYDAWIETPGAMDFIKAKVHGDI
ncbi:uncharacterized protein N7515_001881 [Penicillium bovifimosum]|uniref:MYND-type domain-containing protein n=1 Tax=Penicillium bovifimosum TaxID=126998 RepID=A0A9W9HAJ8_9EURO|nr:uncharacterized protein N7515_001881 [Penicillium bovifimosum]KAJ5143094.1 hypothetical protein N7515_001881 [Penicillium bovifimosum]